MCFSGVKYSRVGDYLVSASKDGSVICWNDSKHGKEGNSADTSIDSNFTKIASITSTGKHFTDFDLLPYECDRTDLVGDIACDTEIRSTHTNESNISGNKVGIKTILSSSDGSLSYYCVTQEGQKTGDRKEIAKNRKSCNENSKEFKFVLLGSTAIYRTSEDIEIQ